LHLLIARIVALQDAKDTQRDPIPFTGTCACCDFYGILA